MSASYQGYEGAKYIPEPPLTTHWDEEGSTPGGLPGRRNHLLDVIGGGGPNGAGAELCELVVPHQGACH